MSLPFDNRDGWIWLNGEFIPWREANSHIINQGLHYGNCVFEGERAYNGKIFKSTEHTDRLFNSAEILGISIPYSKNEINQAKEDLIKKMNFSNCYVRPFIWRGSQQMGISTNNAEIHAAIAVWDDWESYFRVAQAIARPDTASDNFQPKPQLGLAEPLGKEWRRLVFLARAATYSKHPNNYSFLFDLRSMKPLIAEEGFVLALEDMITARDLSPLASSDQQRIDTWIKNENRNPYGDDADRIYEGGSPLFDEKSGKRAFTSYEKHWKRKH